MPEYFPGRSRRAGIPANLYLHGETSAGARPVVTWDRYESEHPVVPA